MWDIHETDNGSLMAFHRETGDLLSVGTAAEANALAIAILQALQGGTYTNVLPEGLADAEWLTMEDAATFANQIDAERFPYDRSKPYHQQSIGVRLRNATSGGSIETKPDPEDQRRVLLSRNDFMKWLRTARGPYKKG